MVHGQSIRSAVIGKVTIAGGRDFPLTPPANLRTSSQARSPMKLVQKRSKKSGLPPGTLVHIGERKGEKVTITTFHYSRTGCEEQQLEQPDRLVAPVDESVLWINVGGVHKVEVVEAIGKQFSLHPLLLEDVANTDQRPKLDDYEVYVFLVMKMLSLTDRQEIAVEQVSLVLGKNYVLSFQENGTDVFNRFASGCEAERAAYVSRVLTISSMPLSMRLSINTLPFWRCWAKRSRPCNRRWWPIPNRKR